MKLKLWQRSLIALGVSSGTLAGIGAFLTSNLVARGSEDIVSETKKSFDNDLTLLKNYEEYKVFFRDPITRKKIADYNRKIDAVSGIPFDEWLVKFKNENKRTPILIVQAGPVEFQNYYPEALYPKTYIDFVRWFSTDVPWGPDMSSLSYFKISKGAKEKDGVITRGTYEYSNYLTKKMNLSPDGYFGTDKISQFVIRLLEKPIVKDQIPHLVETLNKINAKFSQKYGKEKWAPHALRLYSLQKERGKYIPIINKAPQIVKNLEKDNPNMMEKVSDVDVVYDDKTMEAKILYRDSQKLNIDKEISNILIWKALYGKKWKGINFDFLRYTTLHEYGHMQTMGYLQSNANQYVNLGDASNTGNFRNFFDIDELNRYLKARIPQLRALKVRTELRRNGDHWDWDYYEDRDNEYKKGLIKEKPDPDVYGQVAFEYKPTGEEEWTRDTIEKIFGNKGDILNPKKAPYQVDPKEFYENVRKGKKARFFNYSLGDLRAFAEATKIPIEALFFMNTNDNLFITVNPALSTQNSFFVRDKDRNSYRIRLMFNDRLNRLTFLNKKGKFVNYDKILLELKSYNKVPLLVERTSPLAPTFPREREKNINLDGDYYVINPLATDRDSELLIKNEKSVIALLKRLQRFKTDTTRGLETIMAEYHSLGLKRTRRRVRGRTRWRNEFFKPIADSLAPLENQEEAKKWFKSGGRYPEYENKSQFSQYYFKFTEILTRDWVQIIQKTNSKKMFNDKYFPINPYDLALGRYFDPTGVLNQKMDSKSKKTLRDSLNLRSTDPELKKSKFDLWEEFIREMYDYLEDNKDKKINQLSKSFTSKKLDGAASWSKFSAIINSANHLSFMNQREFKLPTTTTLRRNAFFWLNLGNGRMYNKFFNVLGSYANLNVGSTNPYFTDRWTRAGLTNDRSQTGTVQSWAFYDNDGKPLPYQGDLKNVNGDPVKTRPEAFWTFMLKTRGVGLRNISAMFLQPERDAVSIWGFIPQKFKRTVHYLRFKNLKNGEIKRKRVRYDVDNLFYYSQGPGRGKKHYLIEDGFVSWNIDYVKLGTWNSAFLKNGNYQVDFIDRKGKVVPIFWKGKKLSMTGNGVSRDDGDSKFKHIVSVNWYNKMFAPIYIEKNGKDKDIMNIIGMFPI